MVYRKIGNLRLDLFTNTNPVRLMRFVRWFYDLRVFFGRRLFS
jgi:hypothetical protein